ncbi:MAG: Tim44/TimA family putative adaptor protein [Hyphomicrobiales bacterium]
MAGLLNILVPILAIFLVYKLFTTLGKNGDDTQNDDPKLGPRNDPRMPNNMDDESGSNVIKLPTAAKSKATNSARPDPVEVLASAMDTDHFANADEKAKSGLKDLITAHPSFNYREFMNGAETAYEMINLGFAQNDRDILKRLLTPAVYESFESVMAAREAEGSRVNSRFVGFERVQMTNAELDGNTALLSVHFEAKLISTTYDKNEHIIDGDEKHVYTTNDIWTFETDMASENTSWRLTATAKAN